LYAGTTKCDFFATAVKSLSRDASRVLGRVNVATARHRKSHCRTCSTTIPNTTLDLSGFGWVWFEDSGLWLRLSVSIRYCDCGHLRRQIGAVKMVAESQVFIWMDLPERCIRYAGKVIVILPFWSSFLKTAIVKCRRITLVTTKQ